MAHPKITQHRFAKLALVLCATVMTLIVGLSFGSRVPESVQRVMTGEPGTNVAKAKLHPAGSTAAARPVMSAFPSAAGTKAAPAGGSAHKASHKTAPQHDDFNQGVRSYRSGGAAASSNQQTLSITTRRLPFAIAGQSYSATLNAENSSGLNTWTAQGLPAGLSLDAQTGTISGVILQAATGVTEVEVSVTDQLEIDNTLLTLTVLSGANIAAAPAVASAGVEVEEPREEGTSLVSLRDNESLTDDFVNQAASAATGDPVPLISPMGGTPHIPSPVFSTASNPHNPGIEVPGQELSSESTHGSVITAGSVLTMAARLTGSLEVTDLPESTTEDGD